MDRIDVTRPIKPRKEKVKSNGNKDGNDTVEEWNKAKRVYKTRIRMKQKVGLQDSNNAMKYIGTKF